jgi:hypothetical protein
MITYKKAKLIAKNLPSGAGMAGCNERPVNWCKANEKAV